MTTLLCILDGFGLNPDTLGNAITAAETPNFDRMWANNPHATLVTHGERVGLPAGQMGNSEVGHLNIGAGRVVEQWLVRIGKGLKDPSFSKNASYKNFLKSTQSSPRIHLIGLLSNGGVHSHTDHLLSILERLHQESTAELIIHIVTDGRDTPPESAFEFISEFERHAASLTRWRFGSVCGRFFAMDRDKRWERTKKAYDLYMHGVGSQDLKPLHAVQASYEKNITDEFIEPVIFGESTIHEGDGVILWNFREDRVRQITASLCGKHFEGFERKVPPISADKVLCLTEYDKTFALPFLFAPLSITNHLGETVSKAGLSQIRIAETEKYPHVTYFLNGGIETVYQGEDRKLIPSPRDVKTYDQKPQMSAAEVCAATVEAIQSKKYALVVVNFANCDMVGHTGSLAAAIKAVETVDECLGKIIPALESVNGAGVIIADHGNAELMINYVDHTPHTAHTTFPVPVVVLGKSGAKPLRDDGALCDVAPTILSLMGLSKPSEMSGKSLFRSHYSWEK